MKVQCNAGEERESLLFLTNFLNDSNGNENFVALLSTEESDTIYMDYNPESDNFVNITMAIQEKGVVEFCKAVFQGSHPYRSDCGKCPRCYRYRPEIFWNNENLEESHVCNRCHDIIKEGIE